MSILVVDDDPAILHLLTELLSLKGYIVRPVFDSEPALLSAQTNPPDLILLDIMLPGRDGYGVCEALKADPRTVDIPVIFISALHQPFDKVRAFAAGGVDFITKPFEVEEVVARVATHLALRQAQRQLQEQNIRLELEIAERKQMEVELRQHRDHLETLVAERTFELEFANEKLERELTERKQIETSLRESEARFRRLFDQSPVGVAMTSLDCRFLRVNEALCQLTGYTEAELLTLRSSDITHPDDLAQSQEYARQLAVDQIKQYTFDKRYICKDGRITWINLSVRLIRDEAGQPQYCLPVMVDITEHKQAEEALRLGEARLRTLVDHIPFPIWMRDREGRVILQNLVDIQEWGDLKGTLIEESGLPPEVAVQWAGQGRRTFAGEIVREETAYLVEGERRVFEHIIAPVWVGDEVSGLVGLRVDITEHKRQAEHELAESEARYRAIVEDQTELICRCTPEGYLTFVNGAYARYFGKEPEDLLGTSFFELIPEEERAAVRADFASYTSDRSIDTYEHQVIDGKGELRWQQWTDRAFFDEQGRLVEFQSVGRDITRRKQMEAELRQHQDHLEALVAERTAELASVNRQLEQELAERREAEEALGLSEARLRTLVDHLPFSVWMRDREERMILQNRVDIREWGDNLIGTHTLEANQPPERLALWAAQNRRAFAGEVVQAENRYGPEGEEGIFEEIVAPIWSGDTISGLVGVQIDITERKHTEAALRQRVEELAILNQISRAAATVTDLQTIPQVIAEFITALLNAFSTTIVAFDQKRQECQVVARHTTSAGPPRYQVGQVYPLDITKVYAQLLETRQSILIIKPQNSSLLSPPARQTLRQDEVYCLLLTPLLARAEVTGCISIARKVTSEVFTSDEVKLAETVAFQVASAIETAHLFHREQHQRRLAEQRHHVAESLSGILAVLNSNQPLTEILAFIAGQTNQLLGSDANAIFELDTDGSASLLAAHGLSTRKLTRFSLTYEQAALRQAAACRSVVISEQNGKLTETKRETFPYPTLLAVPLLFKEVIYGGLILYFAQPQTFSEETMELAMTFGHQIALALENAHLYDQAREVAVAEERNRLARELHDAVTQTLFSANLIATALPQLWETHPQEAQHSLDKLRLLTRGALAEMRTLLLELRPRTLIESKLGNLLTYLADTLTSRTRIPVELTIVGDGLLPPEVQLAVYRIAQESLNNIGRHAQASQVSLDLHFQPEKVMLRISDNGCGFEPETLPPGHLGIGIMYERAKAINAALEVASRPGAGTQVILIWPAPRIL